MPEWLLKKNKKPYLLFMNLHPLQNRVDPFGRIIRTKARGAWMGNRGLIHNEQQEIVREFRLKAWITCKLEFKGRHRTVMTPGLYTELFFLDEATAFSAGHRPCAECRREDFNSFKSAWIIGNPAHGFHAKTPIGEIDDIIHQERMNLKGRGVTFFEKLDKLPEGSFMLYKDKPFIIRQGYRAAAWTPFGYSEIIQLPPGIELEVLTPRSIVNSFRSGYIPQTAD
jgi:hypothetical protein